jgi:hypothetical protein
MKQFDDSWAPPYAYASAREETRRVWDQRRERALLRLMAKHRAGVRRLQDKWEKAA